MAGRIFFSQLNRGFRQGGFKIPLQQPPVELWTSNFPRGSHPPSSAGCIVQGSSDQRSAGIHVSRRGDQDPRTQGDTPDDFRAEELHATEPKEVTKVAAAKAMQEPPDFQSEKSVLEESKPVEGDADPQRRDEGKAFDEQTRKLEGSALYQGETKGTEKSGHEIEG